MNKYISYILVFALVLATTFASCKDSEPEIETQKFPTKLFPIEISTISDARLFIGGKEVFDKALCESFMISEWTEMFGGGRRSNFFDKDDFMNNRHIPQNITFIAKDTATIGYSYFIIEQNPPFFIFHLHNYQYSASSDYFRKSFNLKQTASGNYTDLKYDIVNLRYHRDINDIPMWSDDSQVYGVTGRFNGKIDCDYIDVSMHPKDTFVFQQYQVKYQTVKQD